MQSTTVDVDELYQQSIIHYGLEITGGSKSRSSIQINLLFGSWFGTTPLVITDIWKRLLGTQKMCRGAQMKHILWALHFLKSYPKESQLVKVLRADKKTLRLWIWYMIQQIAALLI